MRFFSFFLFFDTDIPYFGTMHMNQRITGEFNMVPGLRIIQENYGSAPIFKIFNDQYQTAISLGMPTVDGLLQMGRSIYTYASSIDIDEYQKQFEEYVNIGSKILKDVELMAFERQDIGIELITNFFEYFNTCVQYHRQKLDIERQQAQLPQSPQPTSSLQQADPMPLALALQNQSTIGQQIPHVQQYSLTAEIPINISPEVVSTEDTQQKQQKQQQPQSKKAKK